MEISSFEIRNTISDVLNGRVSREDADRMAFEYMKAFDSGNLIFYPREDKERIWRTIQLLYGIDNKISADQYLYSFDDLEEGFEQIWAP